MTPECTDNELLQRFTRRGDQRSFETLVHRHGSLVYGVAFSRLNSAEVARDITQEVFVALAKKATTLNQKTALAGWLHSVTSNRSIDYIRSESSRKKREEVYTRERLLPAKESAPCGSEFGPDLENALNELSSTDRALIRLRYFQNKSNREAATALGISEEATKKRATRAIKKLRLRLSQVGLATRCEQGMAMVA